MRKLEYEQFSRVTLDAGIPVIPNGDPSLEYYKIEWCSFEYSFDSFYIEGNLNESKECVSDYATVRWRRWLPLTKWEKHPWNEMWHRTYSDSDGESTDDYQAITAYIHKCKVEAEIQK